MGKKKPYTRKSPKERDKEALRHLGRKPATCAQLAKRMNMSSSGTLKVLERLFEAGRVTVAGEGGRGDPYLYSVAGATPRAPARKKPPKKEKTAVLIVNPDEVKETRNGTKVQTRSVKNGDMSMENALALGASSLIVRTVEQKGSLTLTPDSPLFKMLQGSVDFHIKHADEA